MGVGSPLTSPLLGEEEGEGRSESGVHLKLVKEFQHIAKLDCNMLHGPGTKPTWWSHSGEDCLVITQKNFGTLPPVVGCCPFDQLPYHIWSDTPPLYTSNSGIRIRR